MENATTHACAFNNGGAGTTYASGKYEVSPFPRALTSRLRIYNADLNVPIFG